MREAPVAALVGGGDEALPQREALGLAPDGRHLDGVRAVAPRVPLHQPRFVQAVRELQPVECSAGRRAQLVELRLQLAQHVGRQRAREPAAEQRVVAKLVAELRRATG